MYVHCHTIYNQFIWYKAYQHLVVIKNKFAASDKVISFRINNQGYSLIGFNQYVIKKYILNNINK